MSKWVAISNPSDEIAFAYPPSAQLSDYSDGELLVFFSTTSVPSTQDGIINLRDFNFSMEVTTSSQQVPTPEGLRSSSTVVINNVPFKISYYVHYGGIGSWDEGIYAITEYSEKYYIFNVDHELQGETATGYDLEEIPKLRLERLQSNTDDFTKLFWTILYTVKFG